MANFNKVLLIGNMTRDPELSYLPNQTPVLDFGLAVNRRWTGNDGSKREDTCFVDCRVFGKQAEVINKYMSKGSPIFVDGRLDFDTWTAQDGSKRSKHRVTVQSFQFLGRGDGQSNQGQTSSQQQSGPANAGYNQGESSAIDDIPF